ncbi:hypothetical protein M8J75_006842 [Diaphorina citri]|nr:hypothetical protein M8J75_006842 [Diaphorina citri]
MDPEAFLDLANQVMKLKMYPYFDVAHSVLCALHVREDLGAGAQTFSRKHPLSCWLSTMLVIFAGGMVAGEAQYEFYISRYVVFYTPFDIGYKASKFLPVKILFSGMKEIYRCKKIHDGVTHAAKLYPSAYIIMIIIGTLKGNGAGFIKLLERLIRGVWTPTAMEFMQPSFPTKSSIVASIIFVLDKKTDLISAPHALVYFGILSSILLGIHDPFIPFENLGCALFFGGIWDSLSRMFGRGGVKENASDAKKKD